MRNKAPLQVTNVGSRLLGYAFTSNLLPNGLICEETNKRSLTYWSFRDNHSNKQ